MNTTLLVSVPEARHELGDLGNSKFYELVKQGEIKTVKIGKRTFVARSELERYVDELAVLCDE